MSAADVTRFAVDVRRFAERAPGVVISVVDAAISDRLRADTGGDGAFSHGRKLGRAATRITRRTNEAVVDAVGSRAVWSILQGGTRRGVAARHTFTEGASRGIDDAARDLDGEWSRVGG